MASSGRGLEGGGEKGFLEIASRDLIFWTKAEQAGEGKPEDDGEGCILYSAAEAERLLKNRPKHLDGRSLGPASVIRHEESGLYMMFYCAADASADAAADGGLAGASSDPEVWQVCRERSRAQAEAWGWR